MINQLTKLFINSVKDKKKNESIQMIEVLMQTTPHLIISAIEVGKSTGSKIGPTVRSLELTFINFALANRQKERKSHRFGFSPQE